MKKLCFLAGPALLLTHVFAQSLPDISFKEGLWEERTTSTQRPTGTPFSDTASRCHSHAYDAREMKRSFTEQQQCKFSSSSQTASDWALEGTCSGIGTMTPGMVVGMKMRGKIVDEDHMTVTIDSEYPKGMPGGLTGSVSSTEMTYKGSCPTSMKPGDMLETLPNGKTSMIPGLTTDPVELRARTLRELNAYTSRPSSTGRSQSIAQNSPPALSQRPAPTRATYGPLINNADVISLASAGLDDAVILAKIQGAASTSFDSSIEGLKALKAGGVSNDVIKVIVTKASAAEAQAEAQSAAQSDDPNVMHQPGVYALTSGRDGQVHLLQLEHTHAIGQNTSGNSLTMAYGLSKRHVRESLNNPTSPVKIDDRNPTFYIYIPQDTQSFGGNDLSARDFELLKLRVKSKTREVETSSTSNMGMGNSGVEDKAREPTIAQKVKSGIYMVKVSSPLKPGEYAFQHELEGVFYDFSITESH